MNAALLAVTTSHPAVGRVVAMFDEYRCHYGQLPAPVATRTWLLDQLVCQRIAVTAALDETDKCRGFITTTAIPASLTLVTAWSIRDLYVAPDYRRSGIARQLVRHAVNDARTAGALRVSLQTEPDNAPALALYAGAGFQPISGFDSAEPRPCPTGFSLSPPPMLRANRSRHLRTAFRHGRSTT